ncbi:MAG: hypothetical protein Kow0042_08020 [Calditrichia bacterium]
MVKSVSSSKKIYAAGLCLLFILAFFLPLLQAQPRLHEIDISSAQAGQKVELILRGKNLQNVKRVESVRFDGENLSVIDFQIKSDDIILITVQIPENARPGRHKILVSLSEEVSRIWLKPEDALKLYYGDQLLGPGEEIRLTFQTRQGKPPASDAFTLKNIGDESKSLGDIKLPAGIRTDRNLPDQILPGDSLVFHLEMEGEAPGFTQGELRFGFRDSADTTSQMSFQLKIIPPSFPDLQVYWDTLFIPHNQLDPVVLDTISRGKAGKVTFTVKNNENKTLRLHDLNLPPGFEPVDSLPEFLAPNESQIFSFFFADDSLGNAEGMVGFTVDDGWRHRFTFPISASIQSPPMPDIVITTADSRILNQTTVPVEFAETALGLPTFQQFTIENRESFSIYLKDLSLPGGYTVVDSFPTEIGPGQRVSFTLGLQADSAAIFSGMMQFTADNGAEFPIAIPLQGGVTDKPKIRFRLWSDHQPLLPDEETRVWFDSTRINVPVVKDFRMENNELFPITLGKITLPAGFSLVNETPITIRPGESAVFQVRMDAERANRYQGVMTVMIENGGTQTVAFRLSGVVYRPEEASFAFFKPLWLWAVFTIIAVGLVAGSGLIIGFRKNLLRVRSAKSGAREPEYSLHFETQTDWDFQTTLNNPNLHPDFELRLQAVWDLEGEILNVDGKTISSKVMIARGQDSPPGEDDLTVIEGIGPKIAKLLNEEGVSTFSQLAKTEVVHLREMLDRSRLWMADPGTWPRQAKLAAARHWKQLSALQSKLKGGREVPVVQD